MSRMMDQRSRNGQSAVFNTRMFRPLKSSVDVNRLYDGVGTDTRDEKVEQIIQAQNDAQRKMSQMMEQSYLTEAYKLGRLNRNISNNEETVRKSYNNYLAYMNDAVQFDATRQLETPEPEEKTDPGLQAQADAPLPARDRFGNTIIPGQDHAGNVPVEGLNYYGDRMQDGFDYYGNPIGDGDLTQYGDRPTNADNPNRDVALDTDWMNNPPTTDRLGNTIQQGLDINGQPPTLNRDYYGDRRRQGFDYYGRPFTSGDPEHQEPSPMDDDESAWMLNNPPPFDNQGNNILEGTDINGVAPIPTRDYYNNRRREGFDYYGRPITSN